jgi:hypothetical protein
MTGLIHELQNCYCAYFESDFCQAAKASIAPVIERDLRTQPQPKCSVAQTSVISPFAPSKTGEAKLLPMPLQKEQRNQKQQRHHEDSIVNHVQTDKSSAETSSCNTAAQCTSTAALPTSLSKMQQGEFLHDLHFIVKFIFSLLVVLFSIHQTHLAHYSRRLHKSQPLPISLMSLLACCILISFSHVRQIERGSIQVLPRAVLLRLASCPLCTAFNPVAKAQALTSICFRMLNEKLYTQVSLKSMRL